MKILKYTSLIRVYTFGFYTLQDKFALIKRKVLTFKLLRISK